MAVAGGVTAAARPAPMPSAARRYLGDALWAGRIAVGVALLLAADSLHILWQQVGFLLGLALLTYPVRSVRWGTIYNFFLLGLLWGFVILAVQYGLEIALLGGRADVFRSALVAPLTEEPLKVLPLVLVCAVGRWRFRHSYGACDLMLLAGALGCGFAFLEDTVRGAVYPAGRVGPELLGIPVFTDSYNNFVGHGAASAFIGLTFGYLLYSLRWRKLLPLGLLAVAGATTWMIVDHALVNYSASVGHGGMVALARWVWAMDRRGEAAPYVIFALVLLTVGAERLLLHRMLRPLPRLGPRAALASLRAPLRRGFGYAQLRAAAMRGKTLLLYVLARRQLGYLRAHLRGDRAVDRAAIAGSLARRIGEVINVQLMVRRG